ncbi:MAG: hypothetical protein QRY72_01760 [Candidatus Rhabdochlamydia sp.]
MHIPPFSAPSASLPSGKEESLATANAMAITISQLELIAEQIAQGQSGA